MPGVSAGSGRDGHQRGRIGPLLNDIDAPLQTDPEQEALAQFRAKTISGDAGSARAELDHATGRECRSRSCWSRRRTCW